MSKRFRTIHPSDMSRLERIVELTSRHANQFALRTAEAIKDPIARQVADTLIGQAHTDDREILGFVDELRDRVREFNEKLVGVAVA